MDARTNPDVRVSSHEQRRQTADRRAKSQPGPHKGPRNVVVELPGGEIMLGANEAYEQDAPPPPRSTSVTTTVALQAERANQADIEGLTRVAFVRRRVTTFVILLQLGFALPLMIPALRGMRARYGDANFRTVVYGFVGVVCDLRCGLDWRTFPELRKDLSNTNTLCCLNALVLLAFVVAWTDFISTGMRIFIVFWLLRTRQPLVEAIRLTEHLPPMEGLLGRLHYKLVGINNLYGGPRVPSPPVQARPSSQRLVARSRTVPITPPSPSPAVLSPVSPHPGRPPVLAPAQPQRTPTIATAVRAQRQEPAPTRAPAGAAATEGTASVAAAAVEASAAEPAESSAPSATAPSRGGSRSFIEPHAGPSQSASSAAQTGTSTEAAQTDDIRPIGSADPPASAANSAGTSAESSSTGTRGGTVGPSGRRVPTAAAALSDSSDSAVGYREHARGAPAGREEALAPLFAPPPPDATVIDFSDADSEASCELAGNDANNQHTPMRPSPRVVLMHSGARTAIAHAAHANTLCGAPLEVSAARRSFATAGPRRSTLAEFFSGGACAGIPDALGDLGPRSARVDGAVSGSASASDVVAIDIPGAVTAGGDSSRWAA